MTILTTRRPTSTEERLAAAERRSAGAATCGYRAQRDAAGGRFAPPEGLARSMGFPATMRAKKTTYNDQELYHLHGIASVTNTTYEMWDMWGPYDEVIDGGAFDTTLAADPDVAFLTNHRGLTMARTVAMAGKKPTLLLAMEDTHVDATDEDVPGLGTNAYVNPKRTDVSDLVIAIDDGAITEMSFAFMIVEGWWSDDFLTFKITEVDIDRGDVSAVNYGANPYTSIAARQREILADIARMPAGAARAAFRELAGRSDLDLDTLYRAYAAGDAADQATPTRAATAAAATTSRGMGRSLSHVEALLAEDD